MTVAAIVEVDNEDLAAIATEQQRQKEELLESLGISIASKFTSRAAKRKFKENQWLRAASLYYGKLALTDYYRSSESPFSTPIYSNRPDVNVVRSKCSIAIAQTVSMQFGSGDKNWDILPPPNNIDPRTVDSCALMSDEIETQLDKAKYSYNCRLGMWDRVVLGSCVIKGPNSVGTLTRAYKQLQGSDTWVPTMSVDYDPQIVRVNPWFFYPDDTTDQFSALNDTIECHPMTALDIKKLIKHEGFLPDALQRVLEKKPEEYNSGTWTDFAKISENNPNLFKNKYVMLEYHGPITRTQLDKLDIDPCYDSLNDEYYGEVWYCQGEIVRIELEAIEASFSTGYYMSVWEKDPGSVFGFGVPLMMEDAQRVVNESWHMILDNTAISSGPQVAMQKQLITPANGKWELNPRQIWYLTDSQATVAEAIQFFNVPNVTPNIVPIMQMAQQFAEEESGIPLIAAGLTSPEVGDTATGALMFHQASTTLLDFMSEEWDDNITAPIIQAMYAWNMQNNPKSEIKGNYCIDVRTSTQYKNKQLNLRDLEKLSVESAQNPEMAKWINADVLTKMRLDMMNLPSKAVIKTEEEVKAEEEAAKNAPPSPEVMQMQLESRKIKVDEDRLAFDMKQGQQLAVWTHEEKMGAEQARLVEAQARVAVSQNDKEIALLQLQQRHAEAGMKTDASVQIATQNNQTKAFTAGINHATEQQKADAYDAQVQSEHINAQAAIVSKHVNEKAKIAKMKTGKTK